MSTFPQISSVGTPILLLQKPQPMFTSRVYMVLCAASVHVLIKSISVYLVKKIIANIPFNYLFIHMNFIVLIWILFIYSLLPF